MKNFKFKLVDKESDRIVVLDEIWICQEYDSLSFCSSDELYNPFPMGRGLGATKDTDDISRYDVYMEWQENGETRLMPVNFKEMNNEI